ncbi:MAG: ATP-dependent DNA helicase RecG [Anaerolineales bacterium]|nr:ATP-dependent DNA helicase RecG [Anaerolineales bacterium]
MSRSFKRLQRVLKLEAQQGFQNKAVVGGMRQLVTFWVTQAREEAMDDADLALVEQTASALMGYDRLPGMEKRAELVEKLLEKIDSREHRLERDKTAPTPSEKPTSTRQTPAPERQPQRPRSERKPSPPPTPPPTAPSPPPAAPAIVADPARLAQSVTAIKGVGGKLAEKLARLGAETINDLLFLSPRRHDDYTLMKPINRLAYGEQVTVIGTIWEARARRSRGGEMVQAVVSDGTGQVNVTWFNQPWLASQLKAGMQIVLSGKVEQFMGRPVFNAPAWEPVAIEPLKTRRMVPIYPLTEGLRAYKMRQIMHQAVTEYAPFLPDPVPETIQQRQQLLPLPQAVQQMHFPDDQDSLRQAHRRLVFDELFLLQLGMLGQRRAWQSQPGTAIVAEGAALDAFVNSLPFTLTGAQQRALDEIVADMGNVRPMTRLLQGDVGAGKTVVAAAAMVVAVNDGGQAAMMAPTEILAEQHYQGLNRLLAPLGYTVRLLTGSTNGGDRTQLMEELADGRAQILIGTHALIQGPVRFHNLTLAVIDEQHRFGVDQRQALRDKGPLHDDGNAGTPHLLVMSATPIPRTLALSLYGDLDLSILDELPPGRQEIKTRWLRPSERQRAYAFVRGQVERGRQAFIICPLVEESDKIEAVAAVEEHARLQDEIFPDLKLGLLHGRMKSDEKEAVMRDFYENRLHILVSTSVIEVGIDVPNSTVMLIEGANRFGLAQLHQFRGRVGRGEHQSYCLLISDSASRDAEARLQAMESTNDGFVLAEKDLELRGPGEFFGRRQSGLPEVRLAALLDVKMLEAARQEAAIIMEEDPLLEHAAHRFLRDKVRQFWQNAGDVS